MRACMAVLALLAILLMGLEPCLSEDAVMCYWDGGSNGIGSRYIALTEDIAIYF